MTADTDDLAGLLETLENGVVQCGMHEDENTELFHVDDASEAMLEAATCIRALSAELAASRLALAAQAAETQVVMEQLATARADALEEAACKAEKADAVFKAQPPAFDAVETIRGIAAAIRELAR